MSFSLTHRPRRNRKKDAIRRLVRESWLSPDDFIFPCFVMEGNNEQTPIPSMPGTYRYTRDRLKEKAKEVYRSGIPAMALFPALGEEKKDSWASESKNPEGLLQKTLQNLKEAVPELTLITDVAMDPYSSDGHDGVVQNGSVLNDTTLPILADMALSQAQAGADIVAPSDMMDGRVGYIRQALDQNGYENVSILAYSAKYASSFYGPFRDALKSTPKNGDKKSYQMDPANAQEALREVSLDIDEGADMVMIKPGLPYLDVIQRVQSQVSVPVAAYQVSGEYAMIQAAAEKGWLNGDATLLESLTSMKRAGASIILTYFAERAVHLLQD